MFSNEAPHNKKNPTDEEKKLQSRRNFLKGVGVGVAASLGATLGINTFLKKEGEVNALYEEFGPNADIEDIDKVIRASEMLREEILKEDTSTDIIINKSVRLSGTGHPNPKIDILRDYVRRYLNTRSHNENPLSEQILKKGTISINDLDKLIPYLRSEPKISP